MTVDKSRILLYSSNILLYRRIIVRTNGGFQISKIKQLGDRVFEKILTAQGIEAFNGAQGRILYVLWQEDGVPIKTISKQSQRGAGWLLLL